MQVKDFVPINFAIMANPYNWLIVGLMVAFAGMGLAVIFTTPQSGDQAP